MRYLSIANSDSEIWMTVPSHCAYLMGMVLYALATSQMAACDPAGRWRMVVQMVSKVPHVHGKSDDIMLALLSFSHNSTSHDFCYFHFGEFSKSYISSNSLLIA